MEAIPKECYGYVKVLQLYRIVHSRQGSQKRSSIIGHAGMNHAA